MIRFKIILKIILIKYLFRVYAKDNKLIEQDVINMYTSRQCKSTKTTYFERFKHLMLYYPTFIYVFIWRTKITSKFVKYIFNYNQYYSKIFSSTQIKGGLHCYHPFATVINAKSIGKNFEFRNGLTVGNKFNDNNLLPVIGDNVTVGAGVCIIGDIEIGSNVVIGAGAVVVKSIPSNVVVAGNPAKIIKKIEKINAAD